MAQELDPFSPAWREDPYPLYQQLRDHAPVHYVPSFDTWCVSRFDDVQHVLTNPERFSSRAMFTMLMNAGQEGLNMSWPGIKAIARLVWGMRVSPMAFANARMLIASDGERHAGMRRIVNRGFTPRRVAHWEPRIRELVEQCLVPLRVGEPFDIVRDLAIPLPVTIIAEMLGVPNDRLADFKRWSDVIIYNATGPGRDEPFNTPFVDTLMELMRYFQDEFRARSAEPEPRNDLIGTLLRAEAVGDEPLEAFELIQFVTLLLVAGNETTTNLIGNGARALLAHPEARALVTRDPSLVPGLVEETLRYDAPIQMIFRTATAECTLHGIRIPRGATITVLLGSANRDPRAYEEPDRFDPTRQAQNHVGFGFGTHFCLGASLARLEARAAFEGLLPELGDDLPSDQKPEPVDSFLVRGPTRLPLGPPHAAVGI